MKKFRENLKKLFVGLMLLIFSFILFSPNIHALDFDPKSPWNQHNPGSYTPDGDGDPFGENDVYNPPPDDNNRFDRLLRYSKVGITTYLYLKLGWYLNILDVNRKLPCQVDNS